MYLIDTSVVLWWLQGDERLPKNIRSILDDQGARIYVSAASMWEIAIKKSLKKLKVDDSFFGDIANSQFIELPVSFSHTLGILDLPRFHKDPFDRLLIAQAKVENLTVITSDPSFKRYDISILEA